MSETEKLQNDVIREAAHAHSWELLAKERLDTLNLIIAAATKRTEAAKERAKRAWERLNSKPEFQEWRAADNAEREAEHVETQLRTLVLEAENHATNPYADGHSEGYCSELRPCRKPNCPLCDPFYSE